MTFQKSRNRQALIVELKWSFFNTHYHLYMYLHMQKFVFPIPPDPSAFLASFVSIKIFPSLELCCYLVSSVLNDYCWVSWNNRHKVSNSQILCITPVTSNQTNPNSLEYNKQNNFDSFSCNTLFRQDKIRF